MSAFPIEHGAIMKAPVYEDHKRGKNWMAVITIDPQSPGGLGRTFVKRGRGGYLYMTDDLIVGMAVEFGADYYSASRNRSPHRWYGVIRSITDSEIEIEEYASGKDAVNASEESQ